VHFFLDISEGIEEHNKGENELMLLHDRPHEEALCSPKEGTVYWKYQVLIK
jgi:hypothetical protein